MQIKDIDKLKVWLLKKLEPLCDADPAALAKYVVALLRKEKPKSALRELCIDQLEVFLAKETASFVEKLFRCLEGDSYLKGEDTPPPPRTPPPTLVNPALPTFSKPSIVSSPSQPAKPESADRQQSEELRHKEVDDDDRDFRRSKRHDADGPSVGGATRKITAPIGGVVVGGAGRVPLGKKRTLNPVPDSGISKRRVIITHNRSMDGDALRGGAGSVVTSSLGGAGGVRRPVRDRLGLRAEDGRGERGRPAAHAGRSSQSSSSSSSSSNSDSDSSTARNNEKGGARKRRKVAGVVGGGAMGGVVEVKKRQRCKNYDKRGFCILGEKCQYDHGLDPLVIDGHMHHYVHPPPGLPPAMGGVPTLPPPELLVPPLIPQGITGRLSPTSTKADSYNPEEPGLGSTAPSGLIPTHIAPPPPPPLPMRPMFPPPHMQGLMPPHFPHPPPPHHHHHHPHHPHHHPFPPSTMGPPTSILHHMRPRPYFAGGPGGRGHAKPSDAVVVRKIPKELNTITKLSGHFEKFGTIVNLTVRYEGDFEGAMVQFSSPSEAKKAHDCTEAILNNRFVRVYYLRKDELFPPPLPLPPFMDYSLEGPVSVSSILPNDPFPSSTVTSSVPHAPAHPTPDSSGGGAEAEPPRSNFTGNNGSRKVDEIAKSTQSLPHGIPSPTTTTPSPHPHPHHQPNQQQQRKSAETAKKSFELQKKVQELLQKQIGQQKLLIATLEKSGKHLSAEEKSKIMTKLKALSTSITKLTEVANKAVLSQKQEQHPPAHPEQQVKGGHKAALKERAEALRKEAHKLGLLSSPSQPLPSAAGKGRGKGGDLRGKLHSKPKQLLVLGAKDRDQLTTYFESFGGLDSVGVDPANGGNLIFTFRNSTAANQVVNSSSTFQGKPLIMKWYSPKPHPSSLSTLPTVSSTSSISGRSITPTFVPARRDSVPAAATTPTLTKLDPQELHLVEDSDDDEDDSREGRSWRH